jgi:putative transposase
VSGSLYKGSADGYPRIHQKKVTELLEDTYGNEWNLRYLANDLNTQGYQKSADIIERFLLDLMSHTAFLRQHGKRI